MDTMFTRSSRYGWRQSGPCRGVQEYPTFERLLRTCPPPELVRRQGGSGLVCVPPGRLKAAPENSAGACRRPTKLLMNVTIERSLGPVQVVTSPESSVGDLVRTAIEVYAREKRRPLLVDSDPRRYQLHYSPFSLESLKSEEKLMNLGSRNFFMCSKPKNTLNSTTSSSCSDEANMESNSLFPLTKLMDFLL